MKTINLISNNTETSDALRRYLKYVFDLDRIYITDLNNPYEQRTAYTQARESDLLLAEVFGAEKHKVFQFAKAMGKRTLLLFYAGEIEIEEDGPFWIVIPSALEILGEKIDELIKKTSPTENEYKSLEEQFPKLKEKKVHLHPVNEKA